MYGQDQDDIVMLPWTTLKFKIVGQSAQKTNQSASTTVDPFQQVNSLNEAYPSLKPVLYPVASATQLADTPTPVHFTNFDLVLVKARSDGLIVSGMQQIQRTVARTPSPPRRPVGRFHPPRHDGNQPDPHGQLRA